MNKIKVTVAANQFEYNIISHDDTLKQRLKLVDGLTATYHGEHAHSLLNNHLKQSLPATTFKCLEVLMQFDVGRIFVQLTPQETPA